MKFTQQQTSLSLQTSLADGETFDNPFFLLLLLFALSALEMDLRASPMLGNHSTADRALPEKHKMLLSFK